MTGDCHVRFCKRLAVRSPGRLDQTERDAAEEADAVAGAVAALPGQSPLFVQVDEVVLDFLRRDPVRAAAVVSGGACRWSPELSRAM